ncbi:Crp/Fnr family transcriptional regulator [Carnobacterium maltaromaticum]|uniref:Crp/Fnr family transcriptional regulator n=1 Tax=Carnobacterium maltaromaticum TaxID=2751 RepID=A0AAW9K7W1_CARML|nr:Crp/Fnr family transcriptional regulator [Carnobacterium maltaromaticum]MDZ5760705.1 Crp/Fnr family transcriptional regulator [Carnobacterium maltaromaticum]
MDINISRYFSPDQSQSGSKVISRKSLEKEVMIHSFIYETQSKKIYLVTSGIALVKVQSKFGEKIFYSLVSKNQLFGIENLLDESQRPKEMFYTVVAQTDVEYLEIELQFFLDCLYAEPIMYRFFFSNMISQFMFLAQSYQLMNESVTVRIVNTLIELINVLDISPNKKGILTFPKGITQEFIAHYTNASVGRTSVVFNYLENNKIIKRWPIQVVDLEKLIDLRNADC